MSIAFTKMHGLGNDFVVIDAIRQDILLTSEQVKFIADRHFGVGCDQLLLVESPNSENVDFNYRIYNADGGEVGQCGNGARCLAQFVRDKGLSDKDRLTIKTSSAILRLIVEPDGQITVDMGPPRLNPQEIPFKGEQQADRYVLALDNHEPVEIGAVSMGNPHAVIQVENVDTAPVEHLGSLIEQHDQFPDRVNVGFMQIIDPAHIRLRVYERGAGETLACGSGACAAVVTGRIQNVLEEKVKVDLPGGILMVSWSGSNEPVLLTGPATTVFEGTIEL